LAPANQLADQRAPGPVDRVACAAPADVDRVHTMLWAFLATLAASLFFAAAFLKLQ
jgi:hypothetical protein